MSEWVTETIGEICDRGQGIVKTGPFGSQLHQSDYQEHGTPVVMPKDIINGRIVETSIARVSESHIDRLSVHKLSLGDIVYGRRGDIGRQALTRKENVGWLCGTGCLRITLGNSSVDPVFLHRYLQLPAVIGWIQNQAIGATMPNLNTKILRSVPIHYPNDILHQKKITAILSAYDDLIENNNKRIGLLEKAAAEIYREWFVRLRFPGWETAVFHKGVPEGWEMKPMRDLVAYYIGGGWGKETSSLNFDIGAYVIRGTDLPSLQGGSLVRKVFRYHKASNYKSRKLQAGDIIFEVSGGSKGQPLGRSAIMTQDMLTFFEDRIICASFCKLIRIDKSIVSPVFMNYFFKLYYETGLVGIYQVQSTGISNYQFESFLSSQKVLIPPPELVARFDNQALPLLTKKDNLALSNNLLKQTRDLLLSRLISGKLPVDELDIQFPPSMTPAKEPPNAQLYL